MTKKTLKELREKIEDKLDFRNFAEDILNQQPAKVEKNGTELKFICPFGNHDSDPSLNFNTNKGVWHCFGCGEEGSFVDLYMKVKNLDFWPAIKELADRTGVSLPDPSLTLEQYIKAKKLDRDLLKDLGIKNDTWSGNKAIRIPYYDENGDLFRSRCRTSLYDPPGDSRFKWYPDGKSQTLYGLWNIESYNGKVLLVEGESDCHTLWGAWRNYPVLGVPGKSNLANFPDEWIKYLQGFDEITILQEDGAQEAVGKAAEKVSKQTEADIYILDLLTDDVNDLYRENVDNFKEKWKEAVQGKERYEPGFFTGKEVASSDKDQNGDDRTVHEKMLKIAEGVELFRTSDNRMFAETEEDGKPYVYEIKERGGGFRPWIVRRYKEKYGDVPHSSAITRTMEGVKAEARVAEQREVFKRIADLGDTIYVDLAGNDRRAIKITSEGYEVTEDPEINFWRPDGARELPEPEGRKENLKYLHDLLNIDRENFALLVAWLLSTFQTTGPYPVLIPTGPAGSGKSTLTKLIRKLLDPAGTSGRAVVQSVRKSDDLFSVAKHRHVLALDNISKLRRWQSDALSAIATGGGIERRKLYTNDDLATIDTMNPIVMNGIDISGIGDDLLDRSIFLHLEEPRERVVEEKIWGEFEEIYPLLLGGLCDIISTTLSNRDSVAVTPSEMTRMADFTKWIKAASPAIGKIEGIEDLDIIEIYHSNRKTAGRDALQESDLGSILAEFLEERQPNEDGLIWEGKASELLEELERQADDSTTNSKYWPSSPAALGKKMKRVATTLAKIDITYEKVRTNNGRIHQFLERNHQEEVPF